MGRSGVSLWQSCRVHLGGLSCAPCSGCPLPRVLPPPPEKMGSGRWGWYLPPGHLPFLSEPVGRVTQLPGLCSAHVKKVGAGEGPGSGRGGSLLHFFLEEHNSRPLLLRLGQSWGFKRPKLGGPGPEGLC